MTAYYGPVPEGRLEWRLRPKVGDVVKWRRQQAEGFIHFAGEVIEVTPFDESFQLAVRLSPAHGTAEWIEYRASPKHGFGTALVDAMLISDVARLSLWGQEDSE